MDFIACEELKHSLWYLIKLLSNNFPACFKSWKNWVRPPLAESTTEERVPVPHICKPNFLGTPTKVYIKTLGVRLEMRHKFSNILRCGPIQSVSECTKKHSHHYAVYGKQNNSIGYSQIKLLRISRTRLDLECSSPPSTKHYPARVRDNIDRIET